MIMDVRHGKTKRITEGLGKEENILCISKTGKGFKTVLGIKKQ